MKITILTDNPQSWYCVYAQQLADALMQRGHDVTRVYDAVHIPEGDIALFLSCEKIVPKCIRDRNAHNLVVHSSDLPRGRGWSPLTWQVLAGRDYIINTLFEAEDAADAGWVYLSHGMMFAGNELLPEMHAIQAASIQNMILQAIDAPANFEFGSKQPEATATHYPKRTPADSELNIHKSIADQFNLLRVVDNERYPAFFVHMGRKYTLKIEVEDVIG